MRCAAENSIAHIYTIFENEILFQSRALLNITLLYSSCQTVNINNKNNHR